MVGISDQRSATTDHHPALALKIHDFRITKDQIQSSAHGIEA